MFNVWDMSELLRNFSSKGFLAKFNITEPKKSQTQQGEVFPKLQKYSLRKKL